MGITILSAFISTYSITIISRFDLLLEPFLFEAKIISFGLNYMEIVFYWSETVSEWFSSGIKEWDIGNRTNSYSDIEQRRVMI